MFKIPTFGLKLRVQPSSGKSDKNLQMKLLLYRKGSIGKQDKISLVRLPVKF